MARTSALLERILKFRTVLLLVTVVVLALFAVSFLRPDTHLSPLDVETNREAAQKQMQGVIRSRGAPAAYQELKETYANELPNKRHNAAHLFGELLYSAEGLQGVDLCDDAYNYGCYHGFMRAAIGKEGMGAVRDLNAVCVGKGADAIKCQHGLGHGILEFEGYTHLAEALNACKEDVGAPDRQISGCVSGVFMEYNLPGQFNPRDLADPKNPYTYCLGLDPSVQGACIYELPAWWFYVYDADFAKMGTFCQALSGEELPTLCYLGLGRIVPRSVAFDKDTILSTCALLPTSLSKTQCILSAAATVAPFFKGTLTHALCATVPSAERQGYCAQL